MAKQPDLTDLTSNYSAQSVVNNNNQKIKDSFDNTVSRDGSAPNYMEADFDLNSHDLLNGKDGDFSGDLTVRGVNLLEAIGGDVVGPVSASRNTFTGDGSTVDFTLTKTPAGKGSLTIYLNGVYQNANQWTLVGDTLTFSTAPGDAVNIEVYMLNQLDVGTADASNVTTSFGADVDQELQDRYTETEADALFAPLANFTSATWTPVVSDAETGGNVATVSTTKAEYIQIGNLVHVALVLTNIDTTGMTGGNDLYIQGLPTAASNVNGAAGTVRTGQVAVSGPAFVQTGNASSAIRIGENGTGNADFVVVSDLTSGSADIQTNFFYFT